MRCQQCRRSKVEVLYPYGGMLLCFSCNERHNPVTYKVEVMSDEQRERIKNKIIDLESEIHKRKYRLKQDDIAKENNGSVNFVVPRKQYN